jgi:heme O synthase-like polyprenyltransferase
MLNEELQKILPAALITLVITVELAVLPLFIPISFLMLFVIWGVSIYILLILCSWIFEKNEQKRRIAIRCFLFMIASAAIFIIITLVKYFTVRP